MMTEDIKTISTSLSSLSFSSSLSVNKGVDGNMLIKRRRDPNTLNTSCHTPKYTSNTPSLPPFFPPIFLTLSHSPSSLFVLTSSLSPSLVHLFLSSLCCQIYCCLYLSCQVSPAPDFMTCSHDIYCFSLMFANTSWVSTVRCFGLEGKHTVLFKWTSMSSTQQVSLGMRSDICAGSRSCCTPLHKQTPQRKQPV